MLNDMPPLGPPDPRRRPTRCRSRGRHRAVLAPYRLDGRRAAAGRQGDRRVDLALERSRQAGQEAGHGLSRVADRQEDRPGREVESACSTSGPGFHPFFLTVSRAARAASEVGEKAMWFPSIRIVGRTPGGRIFSGESVGTFSM